MKFLFRKASINGDMSGKEVPITVDHEAMDKIKENNPIMETLVFGDREGNKKPIVWVKTENQRGVVGWVID